MLIEIPREEVKTVWRYWGEYKSSFRSSLPGEVELNPGSTTLQSLQVDIGKDPAGFLAFAQAIVDELKANQPPPEKKPRKERSDKGSKKVRWTQEEIDKSLNSVKNGTDIGSKVLNERD